MKIDVSFIRDRFAVVPEKDRAAAIALYLQLVATSGELLLDGLLPRGVLEAGGAQVGISRGRYARREIASAAISLCNSGLLEDAGNGMWQITSWHDHHSSRAEVEAQRDRATERKRRSRQQLTLESTGPPSHRDVTAESQRDNGGDSRAHARTRSATDSDVRPVAAGPNVDGNGAAAPADLDQLLEQLEIHGSLRTAATQEPERALAVARYTIANNAGGAYFRTVFESGDHPAVPEPAAPLDPAEHRERFVRGDGRLLPDDELEYQLRQKGANDNEVIELLDLAADLRRPVAQTDNSR